MTYLRCLRMDKDHVLKETFRLLNERYPIGLYEYLYKFQPDLYKELQDIEKDIDKAYLTATIKELKASLRGYWTFHIEVIELFKNSDKHSLDISRVREEISEDRVMA